MILLLMLSSFLYASDLQQTQTDFTKPWKPTVPETAISDTIEITPKRCDDIFPSWMSPPKLDLKSPMFQLDSNTKQ